MAFYGDKEKNKIDYEILEEKMNKLRFIKGVAIYYDEKATERRIRPDYTPYENNYSIVAENGEFLFDRSFFYLDRFYHSIKINEFGLFVLENLSYRSSRFVSQLPPQCYNVSDHKGNRVDKNSFDTAIAILKNRKLSIEEENDRYELPQVMKLGRFNTTCHDGIQGGGWFQKDGIFFLCNKEERSDGLVYFGQKEGRKDVWQEYVKDKSNNILSLNTFYIVLLMINYGRVYWVELLNNVLLNNSVLHKSKTIKS